MLGVCVISAGHATAPCAHGTGRERGMGLENGLFQAVPFQLRLLGFVCVDAEHLEAVQKGFAGKMTLLQQIHLQLQVNLEIPVSLG